MPALVPPAAAALFLLLTLAPASAAAQDGASPAFAPAAMDTVALPADLGRVLRDYERGWRARDAAALAALFTPDGFVLRPGHPPVRGRDAIRDAYAGSGGPLLLYAFDYAAEDSVAFIVGGYRGRPDRPDSGKFTLTLRRAADGRWLIASDMDNGNR